MKLSDNTLSVLKNFASINSGVVLKPGKAQKTISPEKSILVEATLEDDIPTEFGIYDLNQFLGIITTLKNPDITFGENQVVLNDGELSVTYRGCSANLIITPPDKASFKTENLKLMPDDYNVEVQAGAFAKFTNANNTLTYFIALETK